MKTIVVPRVSQERILFNASYNAPILGEKYIPMSPYHNIFSFYWFEWHDISAFKFGFFFILIISHIKVFLMHLWKKLHTMLLFQHVMNFSENHFLKSTNIFFAIDMMQISSNLFILTHGPTQTNFLNMHNINHWTILKSILKHVVRITIHYFNFKSP